MKIKDACRVLWTPDSGSQVSSVLMRAVLGKSLKSRGFCAPSVCRTGVNIAVRTGLFGEPGQLQLRGADEGRGDSSAGKVSAL